MQVNSLKKCRAGGEELASRGPGAHSGEESWVRGRKGLTDATNFTHESDFQKSPNPNPKEEGVTIVLFTNVGIYDEWGS